MSSLALYHRDAVYRVESFVEKFPESPLALEARWELANYHYKRKNYSIAAEEFNKIRVRELAKPPPRRVPIQAGTLLLRTRGV